MLTQTSTTLLAGLAEADNQDAWRRFYVGYTPMLLAYAKRVGLSDADAQDAVAETLTTFIQKYRAGEYDRERARLKSWLGGIMANKVRKIIDLRPSRSLDRELGPFEPAAANETDGAFEREWQLERLSQAMALLRQEIDPTTFQAFDLYALKDWPVTKVASFLGVSPNVVYISKTRTIQRLRGLVDELQREED